MKRRWRDVATADLKAISAGEEWFSLAQNRKSWWAACCCGLVEILDRRRHGVSTVCLSAFSGAIIMICTNHLFHCGRSFRRRGDLT